MGGLFRSKTEVRKSPFEQNPWEPQQEFLLEGFTRASTALDKAMGVNDPVANMTAGQNRAIGQMTDLGMGAGGVSRAAMAAGMGGVNRINQFGSNAEGILADVSRDRSGDIMATGARMAADPFLQGQIDAALGDVAKAFDRTRGDINSSAVAAGGINSTRAGALEAMAQDEAMDRAAAISSQMRGQAYQTGLDRAMALDANRTDAMMGANAQLGQAGGAAFDTARAGLGMGLDGASAALGAQDRIQQQAQMERDMARFGDLDILKQYMGIVGGNFGTEGFNSEVIKKPSIFQQLSGAAASVAGAFGGR